MTQINIIKFDNMISTFYPAFLGKSRGGNSVKPKEAVRSVPSVLLEEWC